MMKMQRKALSNAGIIFLALILNIIAARYADIRWLLVISIPLLVIALYGAWLTHLYPGYFIRRFPFTAQQPHFELSHSVYQAGIAENDLRIIIGNDQCSQPYDTCMVITGPTGNIYFKDPQHNLNGKNNGEIKYHGRDSLTTYNLEGDGLVWQIAPNYMGCRSENGHFDNRAFKRVARMPEVKMIEIKLTRTVNTSLFIDSSLPIPKHADTKNDHKIFPGSGYTTFRDAEGLVHFIEDLRELSRGKPVGIRLSLIHKNEFHQICHAIRKTGIVPDFIVVEGSSPAPGIRYTELPFYPEMPLYEAVQFVSKTLQYYALEKDIKLITAGKINSGFDILKLLVLGAHVIYAESIDDKKGSNPGLKEAWPQSRKTDLQFNLMNDAARIMNISGFINPKDISLPKFLRRLDVLHSGGSGKPEIQRFNQGSVKKLYTGKTKNFQSASDNKTKGTKIN